MLSAALIARRRAEFDAVHAHAPTLARVDLTTCHGLHRAALEIAHDSQDLDDLGIRARDLSRLRWLLPVLEASLRRGRVVALTARMAADLRRQLQIPEQRIERIPNGVDGARFSPRVRSRLRTDARRRMDVGSARALAFVGHDFKRKGLARAARALAELDDAVLLVAGEDPNDRSIGSKLTGRFAAQGLADRIRFLGPAEEVEQLYAAADVLIAPSLYEGFCLAVLEALSCGLPVIGSAAALPLELGPDGPALRRIPCTSSPAALCRAHASLDERPVAEIEAHARRVASLFSWDDVARRTRAVLAACRLSRP